MMLIQKTFHLRMAREVAKAKLANLAAYYRYLAGIETLAVRPDGVMHLRFRLPFGPCQFGGHAELEALESEDPYHTLFRSCGGDIEVAGMIEYFQIKEDLTEVVLTIDYFFGSRLIRVLDFALNSVERFLNKQLVRLEGWFARPIVLPIAHTNLVQPINGHSAPRKSA